MQWLVGLVGLTSGVIGIFCFLTGVSSLGEAVSAPEFAAHQQTISETEPGAEFQDLTNITPVPLSQTSEVAGLHNRFPWQRTEILLFSCPTAACAPIPIFKFPIAAWPFAMTALAPSDLLLAHDGDQDNLYLIDVRRSVYRRVRFDGNICPSRFGIERVTAIGEEFIIEFTGQCQKVKFEQDLSRFSPVLHPNIFGPVYLNCMRFRIAPSYRVERVPAAAPGSC